VVGARVVSGVGARVSSGVGARDLEVGLVVGVLIGLRVGKAVRGCGDKVGTGVLWPKQWTSFPSTCFNIKVLKFAVVYTLITTRPYV